MAAARPILGLLALLLLAGGIVMEFLVILSGLSQTPENQVYFLQASTNGIRSSSANYHNPARWTFLSLCGVSGGNNANCAGTVAGLTFDPVRNFQTTAGVPSPLLNTSHYFYLSRFAWVFYLIAVFFAVVAFFVGLLALCTRLGSYLASTTTFVALFFQALAASLMTAWTVQGRNAFRSAGQSANLGTKAYAFTWATFACFLLASIFFCLGGSIGSNDKYSSKKSSFRRRGARSRGSFVDGESTRRTVKDEYE